MKDRRYKEGGYTLTEVCRILSMTRQAYYKRLKVKTKEELKEELIVGMVQNIRHELPRIGGRKLYYLLNEELKKLPSTLGRDKFFSILRRNGLLIRPERQYAVTTNSRHRFRIYKNLIKDREITGADRVYVSDITYIRMKGEFCYLFLVTDLYSRKIVGYHLSQSLSTTGGIRAIEMALKEVEQPEKLVHHSDRGFQYCSGSYVELLKSKGIRLSMGEVGNPYDNAVAERVNGILKNEFYLNARFTNYSEAHRATKEAVKLYNTRRPHLSLDYKTPEEIYNLSRATPS